MKELIEKLKTSRIKYNAGKTQYKTDLELFRLEHEDILKNIEQEELVMEQLRTEISEIALKEYNETGNKKLYGGIGIRIMQRLEYSPLRAIDWAKQHSIALMLDKKAFEKIVIAKVETIDFVITKEEPVVTIPMEL